jgi:hypothetical protein
MWTKSRFSVEISTSVSIPPNSGSVFVVTKLKFEKIGDLRNGTAQASQFLEFQFALQIIGNHPQPRQ